ncbi:hypothetical protein HUT13_14820 [Streptomyces harbinensis]|uniref:hypothetical protein n=1 Tax=Streptomyces harbinensis TaxID=1176198 RepID=UPI00159290B1|nr:hypothetical protein [Streptomyces harbinensis]QKV69908.1 hypothetical protein HUT13_14820 [Streptomyces harbinensis]
MHFEHRQHIDHLTHVQPDFSQNLAAVPVPVQSAQICGCQHDPFPAPVPARPQIHISTGGVVVVVLGGVFLTVTIGVILTSLLLTVAIVAGALAMVAFAMALVAMSIKSMSKDQQQNPNAPAPGKFLR